MDKNYTHISILLDRSGSMEKIREDVVGGLNTFVADQKKLPGKVTCSIAQFDTDYDYIVQATDLVYVPTFSTMNYVPRGGTALLDSLDRLIVETGAFLDKLAEDKKPGQVVFVVITDGEENASYYIKDMSVIARSVKHQEEKYSWRFVFLGANIDAFTTGAGLGMKGVSYTPTGGGIRHAMGYASAVLGSSRLKAQGKKGADVVLQNLMRSADVDDAGTVAAVDTYAKLAKESSDKP